MLKEAGEGALSGASGVIMGGIAGKVTGKVASKVGLTAVENGGKTAFVALAENGTAKVSSTVARTAFANAIGTGTAAATVSGGSYVLGCAIDKNKDFSLNDLGTTAVTSFLMGGAIGGVTGGIQGYKGATSYNKALSQVEIEAQPKLEAETGAEPTETAKPELKNPEEKPLLEEKVQSQTGAEKQASIQEKAQARQAQENAIKHARQTQDDLIDEVYKGGKNGKPTKSAEESARVFEEYGKTETELALDRVQEPKPIFTESVPKERFNADADFCRKIISEQEQIKFSLPDGSKLKITDQITDPDELLQALKLMETPYDTAEIVTQRAKSLVSGRLKIQNNQSIKSLKKDPTLSQILNDAAESIENSAKEKSLYIIAGNTASGKSTYCVNNGLTAKNGYFSIDSDEIKLLLPGYKEYGANFTHGISASVARAELEMAVNQGANIVYQTTGTAENVIKAAQNAGYNINVVYCDLSTKECIARSLSRFVQKGRFVDPYYILNNSNTAEKIGNIAKKYGTMLNKN